MTQNYEEHIEKEFLDIRDQDERDLEEIAKKQKKRAALLKEIGVGIEQA